MFLRGERVLGPYVCRKGGRRIKVKAQHNIQKVLLLRKLSLSRYKQIPRGDSVNFMWKSCQRRCTGMIDRRKWGKFNKVQRRLAVGCRTCRPPLIGARSRLSLHGWHHARLCDISRVQIQSVYCEAFIKKSVCSFLTRPVVSRRAQRDFV